MAITSKKIISVEQLLMMDLCIPNYQRPYKWTERNMNQLFNDILEASTKMLSEYRLGTIVIHEHADGKLDIVDGQQRTISLYLIQHVFADILEVQRNKSQISKNIREAKRLYQGLNEGERRNFQDYFLNKCRVIVIKIDNEMEAFQFFDSQNARGKALETHDLLKAYHLREMRGDSEQTKLALIEKWETQFTAELATLFERYLYRIKTWLKQENAHYFTKDGVALFKGIPMNEQYNFIQYHKAAYLFIEKFNGENLQELLALDALIPFQLDQPVLAGRRFFEYTLYYINLKRQVEKIALELLPKAVSPAHTPEQTGTRYVRELFQTLLLYYYDKFGIQNRNRLIEDLFLQYSYQLRLIHVQVQEKSINKYALGRNERLNERINLFTSIRDAVTPSELEMISLDDVTEAEVVEKYRQVRYEILREKCGVITDDTKE